MNDVSELAVESVRAATSQGAILFDRRHFAQAESALLDPTHWAGAVKQSEHGGRGAVWLVRGEFGAGVLRHYRRGGLVGRVNRDRYLWVGEEATRSFREFRLLAELRQRGLAVPAPLIAGYTRHGAYYRADILTALIPEAQTLAQRLRADFPPAAIWRRIGETLAAFHAQGAYHADLNAHNVMIDAATKVWLIDFDRGQLRAPAEGWQRENLHRLRRSLRKLGAETLEAWNAAWWELEQGYEGALGLIRAAP